MLLASDFRPSDSGPSPVSAVRLSTGHWIHDRKRRTPPDTGAGSADAHGGRATGGAGALGAQHTAVAVGVRRHLPASASRRRPAPRLDRPARQAAGDQLRGGAASSAHRARRAGLAHRRRPAAGSSPARSLGDGLVPAVAGSAGRRARQGQGDRATADRSAADAAAAGLARIPARRTVAHQSASHRTRCARPRGEPAPRARGAADDRAASVRHGVSGRIALVDRAFRSGRRGAAQRHDLP